MTRFRAALIVTTLLFQAACVTDQTTYLPDGSLGYHITCGGTLFSMGDCIRRTGEVCGSSGYKITSANGEVIPFSISSGAINGTAGGSFTGGYNSTSGSFIHREIFVKCGASGTAIGTFGTASDDLDQCLQQRAYVAVDKCMKIRGHERISACHGFTPECYN